MPEKWHIGTLPVEVESVVSAVVLHAQLRCADTGFNPIHAVMLSTKRYRGG